MKASRADSDKSHAVPFNHVFGSNCISYLLPIDPSFTNEEEVLFYRLGEEKYQSLL